MIELSDKEFGEMHRYIRSRYGLNLEKKKYLIESKLWLELAYSKSDTYAEYWKKLLSDQTGVMERRMMDQLTTNYTFFCREEKHFEFLRRRVIPDLPPNRTAPLHIWCAGCSTGQECYTLAMELSDCRDTGALRVPFSIFGSDLSATAVNAAQRGLYGSADYARLPAAWQSRYCESFQDGQFRVKASLQTCVGFQRQNLMDLPFMAPAYDLIFCRNVLIYFQDQDRAALIKKLTDALLPGGYLMIGHTESLLAIPNHLRYVQPSVYRKPEGRTR